MPMTREGMRLALESVLNQPIEIGVYNGEPDGEVVTLSDLEEARNYQRVRLLRPDWTLTELAVVSRKVLIRFSGKAGLVAGYFAAAGDRVIVYDNFPNPIPINTDEDVIKVTARITAESLVA